MIRILITGENSYIGTSFQSYIHTDGEYQVDKVSVRDSKWQTMNFTSYDVILHTAAIVHRKESDEMEELYDVVNRELPVAIAQKAKREGVKQFIFLSTMSVYGMTRGAITADTIEEPRSYYGRSKKRAEEELQGLEEESFRVCIIRPPMVYGIGCKGNYTALSRLIWKTKVFPQVSNQRSMIYIENLCAFIRWMIAQEECGIFMPQNAEYVNTSDLVEQIGKVHGRKIRLTKMFHPLIQFGEKHIGVMGKVFGDLTYAKELSEYKMNYNQVGFEESIWRTEDTEKSVLFVATVVKKHINVFHLPYLKYFQEKGYRTYVCARDDYEGEDCEIPHCDEFIEIAFDRNPFSIGNLRAYRQLREVIRSHRFELIHCHTPVGGILTRLAARQARKRGTRVFYTAHGFHFYRGASKGNWILFYPIEKLVSRWTDVLITMNREDNLLARRRMKAKRIEYVPGVGIDLGRFQNVQSVRAQKRTELGVTEAEIMILSVGELTPRKNHEVVLRAVKELNKPNLHYYIAGCGELEGHLLQLAEELGIEHQVHLLGFRVDIPELCQCADLFCFPSRQEGLPVALVEAMASGTPCIAGNVRGCSDLIAQGKTGFLVEPNEVDGWSSAIGNLVEHRALREEIGERGAGSVENYGLKNVLDDMDRIYGIKKRRNETIGIHTDGGLQAE